MPTPTVPCPQCHAEQPRTDERCTACGATLAVARLEVCSGPLRGRVLAVYQAPFTIGRANENDLCLPDMAASRLHARLFPVEGGFAVEDLESRFGVYVDGAKVQRAGLGSSGRLKIGETLLQFDALERPPAPAEPAVQSAIRPGPPTDLLLAVVEAIGSTLVVNEVLERVVDGILRVTRAERGFLLLQDPGPDGDVLPRVAGLSLRVARAGGEGTLGISTSIVNRVMKTAVMAATGNASVDPEYNPAESVMSLGLKTVVCLPLRNPEDDGDKVLGVIYVDNQARSTAFSDESLRAAEALARHATLALHNAQLYEREQRANRELRAARDAALAASRAKSAFLAAMSHELHTPLNAIIGYGEMVQERAADRVDEADQEDVARILAAGRQLLRLVDDVLDMSQLEAGDVQLPTEPVEVARVLDPVLAEARVRAAAQGIRFEATVPDGLRVLAEPRRLPQVIARLLGNALAFTGSGEVRVRAGVSDGTDGRYVELQVADTGPGLSAEEVSRVLEPFVQADSSATRRHGGMGLGLPLSRRLCEAMGGGLRLSSEPGRGTTASVRLRSAD